MADDGDAKVAVVCAALADFRGIEVATVTPDLKLASDLGLDSIHFLELEAILTDLGAGPFPDNFDLSELTVGDVCHFACYWAPPEHRLKRS